MKGIHKKGSEEWKNNSTWGILPCSLSLSATDPYLQFLPTSFRSRRVLLRRLLKERKGKRNGNLSPCRFGLKKRRIRAVVFLQLSLFLEFEIQGLLGYWNEKNLAKWSLILFIFSVLYLLKNSFWYYNSVSSYKWPQTVSFVFSFSFLLVFSLLLPLKYCNLKESLSLPQPFSHPWHFLFATAFPSPTLPGFVSQTEVLNQMRFLGLFCHLVMGKMGLWRRYFWCLMWFACCVVKCNEFTSPNTLTTCSMKKRDLNLGWLWLEGSSMENLLWQEEWRKKKEKEIYEATKYFVKTKTIIGSL